MAVKIRLARLGCRNRQFYRVMVADSTCRRDGKHLEVLGYYDPLTDSATHGYNYQLFMGVVREPWQLQVQKETKTAAAISDSTRPTKLQGLNVYEINDRDRGSSTYLRLSKKEVNSLGDLAPFSNKVSFQS
ncbi:hypothetical protein IFM89_029346 [Coptis chinensis]|uniref:allene-oxide cyclase n=1 Tax=Coptis chinensis TaxID=261450 RepID=A0A835ISV7_9MAGN|nr:hypothetical protein IFM89_029346 [Coptis chinensis]